MSKTKKIIPELRFPEFENEGEWEIKTLSGICDITNGKANAQDHVDNGRYPLFDRSEVIKASDEFIFDCEAVIIPGEGMRFIPKYYEGKFNLHQRAYALKDFSCSGQFVYYSMLHRSTLLSQKAVQSTVLSLRLPILQDFPIEIPKKPEEQQKIASCLSSLDELIAAHNDKLDALKDHKKGLLQNLFPQEGETVPKVRFPEFEEDGEWELKPFSKFIKLYRGSSPRPIREYLTKEETGVNWIKIGDTSSITDFVIRSVSEKITPKGAEKSRRVKKGELILANSMSYGSTYLLEVEGCIYDGWFVLREYEEHFDKQFLLQLLNSEYTQGQYKRFAAGGIVQNISSEIVYSITLSKTSKEEQQKIASCLSAVDELITAQQDKIEQLQQHKKGLMQGLFPKIND